MINGGENSEELNQSELLGGPHDDAFDHVRCATRLGRLSWLFSTTYLSATIASHPSVLSFLQCISVFSAPQFGVCSEWHFVYLPSSTDLDGSFVVVDNEMPKQGNHDMVSVVIQPGSRSGT